jgi:hypothetical protein
MTRIADRSNAMIRNGKCFKREPIKRKEIDEVVVGEGNCSVRGGHRKEFESTNFARNYLRKLEKVEKGPVFATFLETER